MTAQWKRPDNIPFPKIWKRFGGRIRENGRYNKYRVQDLTEDMIEDAVNHIVKYFMIKENLCSSSGLVEDEVSRLEMTKLWRELMKEKLSLVVVVENEEYEDGKEKLEIAGLNVLCVEQAKEKEDNQQLSGKIALKILSVLDAVDKESKTLERHNNISCVLKGFGMSVSPAYQKDNVGYELLMARDDFCRAMNIPLTVSVFTGAASQHIAAKAGYTTVVDHPYSHFTKDGEIMFPRIADQRIKFMEKLIK